MNAMNTAISKIGVVPVIKLNHPERDAAALGKALAQRFLDVFLYRGAVLYQILRPYLTDGVFHAGLHLRDDQLGLNISDADVADDVADHRLVVEIVELYLNVFHRLGVLGIGGGVHLVHLLTYINGAYRLNKRDLKIKSRTEIGVDYLAELVFNADIAFIDDGKGKRSENRYHKDDADYYRCGGNRTEERFGLGRIAAVIAIIAVVGAAVFAAFGIKFKIHICSSCDNLSKNSISSEFVRNNAFIWTKYVEKL